MFKELKMNALASAGVFSLIGLVLVLFPALTLKTVAYAIAAVLIITGAAYIAGYMRKGAANIMYQQDMVKGIIFIVIGAIVFFNARTIISILPTILGIGVIISGLSKLQSAMNLRRMGAASGNGIMATAVISLVIGALVVFNPFSTVTLLMRIVGVGFLYSGLTDIFTTLYVGKKYKEHIVDGHSEEL